MAKKKAKVQKDLFGKGVEEEKVRKSIGSLERKVEPWEKKRSFDYDEWRVQVRTFRNLGNKRKEFECYDFLANSGSWNLSSDDFLRKGTLLVDIGKLEEAFEILDDLYGCEGHDTVVAPAQLQLARISAIQGKEDRMFFYLKEAFRTTVFFGRFGGYGHYDSKTLRVNIARVKEFDRYRNTREFQEVVNFEWDREDEIELENKIAQYFQAKRVNPKHLDTIRLGLVEFLCKYPDSEISLDFTIENVWLTNSSNSIVIIKKSFLNLPRKRKGMVRLANLEFSQGSLTRVQSLYSDEVAYTFEKRVFPQKVIETVQKIIEGRIDVHVYENFLVFEPLSYARSPSDWRSYRVYDERRDNDFYAIAFSEPLKNIVAFVGTNGTKEFFTSAKSINSNFYYENDKD